MSAMPERMMPRWADHCPKAYELYRKVYEETNEALKACRVPPHIISCVNAALARAWAAGQDSAEEESDKLSRPDASRRGPVKTVPRRKPTE